VNVVNGYWWVQGQSWSIFQIYNKNATKPSLRVCVKRTKGARKKGISILGRRMRYQEKAECEVNVVNGYWWVQGQSWLFFNMYFNCIERMLPNPV